MWLHLKQALEVYVVAWPVWKLERWPQGSHQELGLSLVSSLISVIKYLKCHFHKIPLEGLRAFPACLSGFVVVVVVFTIRE
jgi:hypothetical protein